MLPTSTYPYKRDETGLTSTDIGKLHNLPSASPAALLRLAYLILNNSFYRLKHEFLINETSYNALTNYGKINPKPTLAALVILWRQFATPFLDSQKTNSFDNEGYLVFLQTLKEERPNARDAILKLITFLGEDLDNNEQAYWMYRSRWTPELTNTEFEFPAEYNNNIL